jgi:hypothetical protein
MRHDEVYGLEEIGHAFRVTVRATNGYVYPASHRAGSNPDALPMGARLRLKADVDTSGYEPAVQKIFRAMKRYGLIVADNGSDMYVSGTFDTRWDNDVLNPAFASITASDFEVIELGWNPPPAPAMLRNASVTSLSPLTPRLDTILPLTRARDLHAPSVRSGDTDREAVLGDGRPLLFYALDATGVLRLEKAPGATVRFLF